MDQKDIQNKIIDDKKRLKEILEILMHNNATKQLTPEKASSILKDLGPFFVRLGKIISSRQDILPKDYRDVLATLDDSAVQMDYAAIQTIIENEYGVAIDGIFSEFDETPIDVSSISQTHKAVLKEGSSVIIKIQKPEVHAVISRDITLLRKALNVLKLESSNDSPIDLNTILDELWSICKKELNYLIESENNKKFYEMNHTNSLLLIPRIHEKYSTSNILVVEYIDSINILDKENLSSMGYNSNQIAIALAKNYIHQFLNDGFFHANPNEKNISFKNGKIVWSNFTLMGSLTQKELGFLNNAIVAAKSLDVVAFKNIILSVSNKNSEINNTKLYSSIEGFLNKYKQTNITEINILSIVKDFVTLLNENTLSLPEPFSLLCIGLITIDSLLNDLNPDFNMTSLFCDSYPSNSPSENEEENNRDILGSVTQITDIPKEFMGPTENPQESEPKSDLSLKQPNKISQPHISIIQPSNSPSEITIDMVTQVSNILKMAADGKTKLNLNLTVSDESLFSIEKIVNKLILCLISVSFLIGACSTITSNIEPRIMGIPVLGIILFAISIILLVCLFIRIIRKK